MFTQIRALLEAFDRGLVSESSLAVVLEQREYWQTCEVCERRNQYACCSA